MENKAEVGYCSAAFSVEKGGWRIYKDWTTKFDDVTWHDEWEIDGGGWGNRKLKRWDVRVCWSPRPEGCKKGLKNAGSDDTTDTATTSDWSTWKTAAIVCGVTAFLALIATAVWRRRIVNNKTTTGDLDVEMQTPTETVSA